MERDAGTQRRGDAARTTESRRQKAEGNQSILPSVFHRVTASPRHRVPFLRRPLFIWAITATLVLGFVSLIIVAPVAQAHGYNSAAFVLYEMFGRGCHQIPERAFHVEGHPLAVCARCTGIYFGFAAGVLFCPLVRSLRRGDTPARKWLLLAAVPMLLDFALGFFGIWENTHWSRSVTGALPGVVAAFYVLPGLVDLSRMSFRRFLSEEMVAHEQ